MSSPRIGGTSGDGRLHGPIDLGLDDFGREMLALLHLDENPAKYTSLLLLQFVENNEVEKVREMLSMNVDLDFRTSAEDRTPLQLAAHRGRPEMMRMLLQAKANPDIKGPNGLTALHEALLCEDLNLKQEMVRLLLNANANINISDDDGSTVLDMADRSGTVETQFLFVEHFLFRRRETPETLGGVFATSKLSIKVPRTLSSCPDLCETLFRVADLVYHELDKLPNSGFAIGLDILANDICAADESLDSAVFSGIIALVAGIS